MPGGDRTGPWGLGPRTGRAAGYCVGYNVPGYANNSFVRGVGFGRGRGRGFGRAFRGHGRGFWGRGLYPYPEPSKEEEKTYLEDMIKNLDEEMKMVRERLQELSKKKGNSIVNP